jgi:hypothetical protein
MAWAWGLVTLLLVALPQVQAAPWTVWACEGGSESRTVAPASGAGSCCVWTGDSEGASMQPGVCLVALPQVQTVTPAHWD